MLDYKKELDDADKIPLKPCPFCGNPKPSVAWARSNEAEPMEIQVVFGITCKECGAQTTPQPAAMQAVTAWNRRV